MGILSLVDFGAGLLVVYLIYEWISRRRLHLPPGPPGFPILRNLLDLPKSYNHIHWAKYKGLYGPISSLSVTGDTFIILNSQKACVDLLEKRSANYSERPYFQFASMAGYGNVTTILPYGNTLMTHRKNMYRFIGTKEAMANLHHDEEIETRRFVSRVLKNPVNLRHHIGLLTGGTILKISHGYTVDATKPDPLLELIDKAILEFSLAVQPGKWAVDIFPFLRFIPEWMPGAGFKGIARQWKDNVHKVAELSHQFVKKQMAAGAARPSLDSYLLEKNPSPDEEYNIKWTALTMYGGGEDTSISAIYTLFIAMQLYPDVQKKAQDELDRVVGSDRMPSFADRPRLPYVDAVMKEIFRWNTVLPLGVPHVAKEKDIYEGYLIPKGAQVVSNIWAITHDPDQYHEPFEFKPERFLGLEPELDPRNVIFGYGRRMCPGKELADATVFIAIAMCLATLNIGKGRDDSGRDIDAKYESTDGLISHPKPFPCTITARSARAEELIMAIDEEGLDLYNDAKESSTLGIKM